MTVPRKILILEDEMLIALDIEEMLIDLGHRVVALCTRLPPALIAARDGDIDLAVLDMNVAGVLSFPVAAMLRARGVPFLFLTGYGAMGLIEGFTDSPVLGKPFSRDDLSRMVAQVISSEQPAGQG